MQSLESLLGGSGGPEGNELNGLMQLLNSFGSVQSSGSA